MRHIHHQRDLRVESHRAGAGAAPRPGDLLPRRRHGEDARMLRPALCQEPQRLCHDVRADPVVDAARHDPPIGELEALSVEHRGVADAHSLEGLALVRRTDVDPQVFDLGDLVEFLLLHQVRGLLADHTLHGPLRSGDYDALADQHLGVPPADAGEVQVALVVHMGDLQADLVHVPREHQPRRPLGIHDRDRVAVRVSPDLVREALHFLAPHARGRRFEAGGTGGVEQLLEKAQRLSHEDRR